MQAAEDDCVCKHQFVFKASFLQEDYLPCIPMMAEAHRDLSIQKLYLFSSQDIFWLEVITACNRAEFFKAEKKNLTALLRKVRKWKQAGFLLSRI